ncbi:hexose kinase [Litorilinea aerophila]|uniref:Hexose kinase n=1 Tax=Litorilinea aerophila TaxID=1204385 RepID=A0A540VMM4_9CHLR|nr:hexose kinase [Litorilinea aerophila]MCC9074726.1 hexose kinase [Litorilinea aerophila]
MILTVTLNPTIDRVLFIQDFALGDVVRAEREVVSPSGKGIDVSLIVQELGGVTRAIALNAGYSGQILAALLAERQLPCDFVPAHGHTRMACLLTEQATGRQSTILAPTLVGEPAHLTQVVARLEALAPAAWGVACAGSIPPGLPADSYRTLILAGRRHGLVTLLDASGPGLRAGVASQPDILKVNLRELAELVPEVGAWRQALMTKEQAADFPARLEALARLLAGQWPILATQALVVTLGSQGLVAFTHQGRYHVPALDVPVVSPAGAGDAVSAGILLARSQGKPWDEALALGTAAAAAVVMNEGTAVCTRQQVETLLPQVHVLSL